MLLQHIYMDLQKNEIYMKILERFKLLEENSIKPRSIYLIKLQQSLYGFK